jgi:antitoxin VapB
MPDLNIKNPEAYRLVKELSDRTGESMTQAVIESVRERLERLRTGREAEVEARVQRIMELAKVIHDAAPPGYWDQDFDELLYDERGLPK